MSRRCLICANINPCREHSGRAQEAELDRNSREVRRIVSDRATSAMDKAAVNGLNPALGHADGCGAHDDYACDCGKALAQPAAGVPAGMVLSFWSGLDHIANFINSLDTSDMTAKQVRTAIYSECLTARPKQATPTDEAVLGEREACAQVARDHAAWEREQAAKPGVGKKAANDHLGAAHACEMVGDAIRARPAPGSAGDVSDA